MVVQKERFLSALLFPLYLPGFVMSASRAHKSPFRAQVKDALRCTSVVVAIHNTRSNSSCVSINRVRSLACSFAALSPLKSGFQVDRSKHPFQSYRRPAPLNCYGEADTPPICPEHFSGHCEPPSICVCRSCFGLTLR